MREVMKGSDRRKTKKMHDINDERLWEGGKKRTEWAGREMSVLHKIREKFSKEKPLDGVKISACLHVTTETANLILTLLEGGASVRLCASNPLSTQDDVAAYLVKIGVEVFAKRGESNEEYHRHIKSTLEFKPDITMDDGADLTVSVHKGILDVIGGTEETTTGVTRLKVMARRGMLRYPIIAVNDAYTKYLFDNRYGTGQSTIDGILRATNVLLAGKRFAIAGYGWCGRGIAIRARGMGANVIVVEADPIRALEALMDGFQVMSMSEAAPLGDIFVTSTGNKDVIREEHLKLMKDGAILANAGHFDVEIDKRALEKLCKSKRKVRENVEEYILDGGKKLYLLTEGRLVNLGAAEGHPSAVMDMSFANQALSVEYLVRNYHSLKPEVMRVPEEIDREVALLKLGTMGVKIEKLTEEQKRYLEGWEEGT